MAKKPKPGAAMCGDGEHNSCYHLVQFVHGGCVRLQINAGDVLYLRDMREVRKIARWLNRVADARKQEK